MWRNVIWQSNTSWNRRSLTKFIFYTKGMKFLTNTNLFFFFFFFFLKIYLGINGKVPKGYKQLIHENIITILASTNMLNSKSPNATTLETTFTNLKNWDPSIMGGPEKATLVEHISTLFSPEKRWTLKTSLYLGPHKHIPPLTLNPTIKSWYLQACSEGNSTIWLGNKVCCSPYYKPLSHHFNFYLPRYILPNKISP